MKFFNAFNDSQKPYKPKSVEHVPLKYHWFHYIFPWFIQKGYFWKKYWYLFQINFKFTLMQSYQFCLLTFNDKWIIPDKGN
jgi:hypothetical protein